MTPKFLVFLAYEYSKYAKFYADFKSVEITGKKSTQTKFFAKHFCKLVLQKIRNSNVSPFYLASLLANFSHFSQQIRNQHKIIRCFDTYFQIFQKQGFTSF
jgi:hypothetical protein